MANIQLVNYHAAFEAAIVGVGSGPSVPLSGTSGFLDGRRCAYGTCSVSYSILTIKITAPVTLSSAKAK